MNFVALNLQLSDV